MTVYIGAVRSRFGRVTKLSKLKIGENFSKIGKDGNEGDRVFTYTGKERRYNRWGDFLGWEYTFGAWDDISYSGRSVKDIDVVLR